MGIFETLQDVINDKMFNNSSAKESSIETLVKEAVKVEAELIVDDEEETEIEELPFKL